MTAYRVPFVDYPRHYEALRSDITDAIERTIFAGNLILRDDVRQFERQLAELTGNSSAVGVNSCTDALIFALRACGIGPGAEVVTVAHTFLATIEAIIHVGATPVLVDVGDDYLMDMEQARHAVTPRTRAIIPVHLNGRVCDMDACLDIARSHELAVIEDAAQALCATYAGRPAGSFGRASCFSFYPAKLLGAAGDAGAICTNDMELVQTARHLRDHGREGKDRHVLYGFTSRLDNVQAAILNVKLPRLEQWITRRRELAALYDERLARVDEVKRPPRSDELHCDVYQNYVIQATRRNELASHMREQGVEVLISNPIPVHKHPALSLAHHRLPNTERLADTVLSLPLFPELEREQVEYVCSAIESFYAA